MNLKGIIVKHEKYGVGTIIQNTNEIIIVKFQENEKKFAYPGALGKYLIVIDPSAAAAINDEINKMKCFEREEMVKVLFEKRKIQFLVHFTRIDNLASILQNGLVPVTMQQSMEIKSIHNDDMRLDFMTDCTSCSVEFPNYKLFYTFREHKFPGTHWVIIAIAKEVTFSPANVAYFCSTNAARIIPRTNNSANLCTADAFESMFCETITRKDGSKVNRASLQIDDSRTTDPQAEILISGIIGTQYIRGVFFQSQQDRDDYISQNGSDDLCLYDHQIDPSFFAPREDFTFWQKEN